jgi:hypothetical protein
MGSATTTAPVAGTRSRCARFSPYDSVSSTDADGDVGH